MEIAPLSTPDEAQIGAIVTLWEACGLTRAWNDPRADIVRAVNGPASALLVGRIGADTVATAMVGHDGHRGAVYYMAVAPGHQRAGHGAAMMAAVEAWLRLHGAPKLNLMVRPENRAVAAFYRALGYGEEERLVLAKRL
ncbi:GNAT family acetyltransferase [Acuticoccus sp. MNP-M23]|uniref:GNAT family acetyltransferase n=1 Tax=Acuticoccus sp. MNP-M23 TaxID=3072793 RepID=UPI0028159BA3|nr:GNAT family acetyltransferase [Acuticoccus sp. MNP-M23]WMS43708.1 GNAT family acetyltransferase [Acuticoccus sp. MNP-M23]